MEAWYHLAIARMTPTGGVTWRATSNAENSWPRFSAALRRGRLRLARSRAKCGASASRLGARPLCGTGTPNAIWRAPAVYVRRVGRCKCQLRASEAAYDARCPGGAAPIDHARRRVQPFARAFRAP